MVLFPQNKIKNWKPDFDQNEPSKMKHLGFIYSTSGFQVELDSINMRWVFFLVMCTQIPQQAIFPLYWYRLIPYPIFF